MVFHHRHLELCLYSSYLCESAIPFDLLPWKKYNLVNKKNKICIIKVENKVQMLGFILKVHIVTIKTIAINKQKWFIITHLQQFNTE